MKQKLDKHVLVVLNIKLAWKVYFLKFVNKLFIKHLEYEKRYNEEKVILEQCSFTAKSLLIRSNSARHNDILGLFYGGMCFKAILLLVIFYFLSNYL